MVVEVVTAEVAAVAVEVDVDSVATVEVLAAADMVEVENAADTVVVVLPLVPVTRTQPLGRPAARLATSPGSIRPAT